MKPDRPFSGEVRHAVLKTAGTQSVVSERLNSSVIKGARTSMTDLIVGSFSGQWPQWGPGLTPRVGEGDIAKSLKAEAVEFLKKITFLRSPGMHFD